MQACLNATKEESKGSLQDFVELLRYGPRATRQPGTVFATIAQIAAMANLSTTTVSKILRLGTKKVVHGSKAKPGRASKLTAEHIQFLVAPETLQRWAAKTLQERVTLFHR